MAVAGYFLVQGLSQFAGSGAAKNMLIVGGILFQITESICFIAASALTYHSLRWRYILFSLGLILFSFSIGVMTLAQKTALQTGEAQAQAIDEKREHVREQIASLQQVIDSYRFNAEKQSKSIYKDSRALGQDSINRAAELEERKIALSEELFSLNSARKQTASDFFIRLEEVTGFPAKPTEFYFLVLRSLLLELSGIILMSFGANLRAYNKLVLKSDIQSSLNDNKPWFKKLLSRKKSSRIKPTAAATITSNAHSKTIIDFEENDSLSEENLSDSSTFFQKTSSKVSETGHQLSYLATMVMDLYDQQLLQELNPVAIMEGLQRYCSQNISQDTAGTLSKMINKRLDETC